MYKYYLTMAHYPEDIVLQECCHSDSTPPHFVDINTHRWKETKVFRNTEEYIKWHDNHPFGWHVISVDKVEKI